MEGNGRGKLMNSQIRLLKGKQEGRENGGLAGWVSRVVIPLDGEMKMGQGSSIRKLGE